MSSQTAFDEFRRLLTELPDPRPQGPVLSVVENGAVRPEGGWAGWLSAWQGRVPPSLDRPRIAIFADGRVPETRARIAALIAGDDPLHAAAETIDADLRLFEMITERPGEWTAEECARAMAYGMTAVDETVDLLALGNLPDMPAAAGVMLAAEGDPFERVFASASPDLAGLLGALLAARMAGVPVLIDGAGVVALAGLLADAGLGVDAGAHARSLDDLVTNGPSADAALATAIEALRNRIAA